MNRAIEFLREAYALLDYPIGGSERAQLLVRLALAEVQELLDLVTDGEPDQHSATRPPGGVLIEDARAMAPARLIDSRRPRAALPGNGRQGV